MFSLLPDFMKVISLNDASSSLQFTKAGDNEINVSQNKYGAHTTVRNLVLLPFIVFHSNVPLKEFPVGIYAENQIKSKRRRVCSSRI